MYINYLLYDCIQKHLLKWSEKIKKKIMNKTRDEAMVMTTVLISPLHPLQSGPQAPQHITTQLNSTQKNKKTKKGGIFTIDPTTLEIVNFFLKQYAFFAL